MHWHRLCFHAVLGVIIQGYHQGVLDPSPFHVLNPGCEHASRSGIVRVGDGNHDFVVDGQLHKAALEVWASVTCQTTGDHVVVI